MEILVEQGASRGDCAGKITAKYGPRFTILREKKIRMGGFLGLFTHEGVELEFYIPPVLRPPLSQPYEPGSSPPSSAAAQPAPLNFEEEKKKLIIAAGKDPEQTTAQAAAMGGKDSSRQILDELREIKEKIESGGPRKDEHPSLLRAAELLKLNEFSERYISRMLERARKELPLETLDDFDAVQDHLLEWIGESIKIYNDPAPARKGRILVLVGPTGVGKTTTIAKFAAIYGIEHSGRSPVSVRLVTIDAFRIGAKEQLIKYGEIMDFPVSYIVNRRELKKEIALYSEETDLILVDTIGKSPKDSAKLGEMKELLDACGSRAEIHLVFSASTKTSDIEDILRQFEPFNYRSVVLTKLDETSRIGNVISALAERGKPVSYITDGQTVPSDITKASAVRFLINLEEFKVDREKMEKRFPVDETDQFHWS
jgi:flagellar biosynthesis protein FlhF